jgi:predicted RNA-binding Zn ribbon-like protein
VQEFVNSLDLEAGFDAWSDCESLAAWMREHGLAAGSVSAAEHARAIALREALRELLWANNGHPLAGEHAQPLQQEAQRLGVSVGFPALATARLTADRAGVDGLIQAVIGAVATAMIDQRWPRLKACWNEECRYVFWDATRNRSGRWCTMRRCGTQLAARAYRRRRASTQ